MGRYKNLSKCHDCGGQGVVYYELNRTAGFNQFPIGVSEVAEGGFKTDRDTLRKLSMRAKGDMKEFVDLIIRYNAIDTYLNTFVNGIRDHVNTDSILHLSLCSVLQQQPDCLVVIQTSKTNHEEILFLFVKLLHLDLKVGRLWR